MLNDGRFFSIDIAFPDEKIGIEVNGNQHYDLCQEEINRTYYKYYGNNLDIYTKFSSGNFIKTFSTTLDITDCV